MNPLRAGLYALAFLWTLLITALIGNVIYDAIGGTPASINYVMFAAVWSWLTLLVGFVGSANDNIPIDGLIIMDALALLFIFIAAVELGAKLGVHSCFNTVSSISRHLPGHKLTSFSRTTSPATIRSPAHTTSQSGAKNSRPATRSYGSCSLHTSGHWF